jgi:hypothetical protein
VSRAAIAFQFLRNAGNLDAAAEIRRIHLYGFRRKYGVDALFF